MKAFQKFVQFTLILVISLTSMGFRVNLEECHGHQKKQILFLGAPDCCCKKERKEAEAKEDTCRDLTCVVQANYQSQSEINSATRQSTKDFKTVISYRVYTQIIRPVLQEKIPHFTLPPPPSGREIGILHQTFII